MATGDGKRVAVLGAGANGGGVGAELAAAGVDVTLIEQWPAHVEKMHADGLRIVMPDRVLEQPVDVIHLCEVAELKQPFDVVLIDGNHFNLIGWDREDPVGTVVMQANAGNVGTVVVGGNVVKRDGAMVGVDPAMVRDQVESSQGYVRGWADEHGGILPQPRIELGF